MTPKKYVRTYGTVNGIKLKLSASFSLRELPVETNLPLTVAMIDRWTPMDERSKDRISSFKEVDEGWIEAYDDVWFGFEGEDMVFPEHVFSYYNIVVLRNKMMMPQEALSRVEARLCGGDHEYHRRS